VASLLDVAIFNEYAGWYWAGNAEMPSFHFDIRLNKQNQFRMLDKIPGLRGITPWVLVDFRSPGRA
jgi:beta-glucuronidase